MWYISAIHEKDDAKALGARDPKVESGMCLRDGPEAAKWIKSTLGELGKWSRLRKARHDGIHADLAPQRDNSCLQCGELGHWARTAPRLPQAGGSSERRLTPARATPPTTTPRTAAPVSSVNLQDEL